MPNRAAERRPAMSDFIQFKTSDGTSGCVQAP
jgi:hypothetical protein